METQSLTSSPILASMKKWLSKEDIVELYGEVSDQQLRLIRQSGKVTYSRHPLAERKFIYLASELEALVGRSIVTSKSKKAETINH